MLTCKIQRLDEEPEEILYTTVRAAYNRIKERAEEEGLSVSDYTIIPITDEV